MTRVRIAPPATEEDVSAEQVTAYLLRPGSGWVEMTDLSTPSFAEFERNPDGHGHNDGACGVPREGNKRMAANLVEAIHDIARAEQRHPSAVIDDIVGPARAASVGAECYSGSASFEEAKARFECKARMGLVKWMKPPADRAARGAGESEAD